MMDWVVKSRPVKLTDVVPGSASCCPSCDRKVGTHFTAIYDGTPDDPRLVGWRCDLCQSDHWVENR